MAFVVADIVMPIFSNGHLLVLLILQRANFGSNLMAPRLDGYIFLVIVPRRSSIFVYYLHRVMLKRLSRMQTNRLLGRNTGKNRESTLVRNLGVAILNVVISNSKW